jgi:hypothetical protein
LFIGHTVRCPTVTFWAIKPVGPFPGKSPTVALRPSVFSYCSTHIKVYGHRFVGVINPGVANELLTAGEALGLYPFLSMAIDWVKTDILTIMRAHSIGVMVVTQQWFLHNSNKYGKPEFW